MHWAGYTCTHTPIMIEVGIIKLRVRGPQKEGIGGKERMKMVQIQ